MNTTSGFKQNYFEEFQESVSLDHDVVCTIQAGQLLAMNCLEYEVAAYAVSYYESNEIYYYISSKEKSMQDFIQSALNCNRYCTPLRYFFKRYDVMDTTESDVQKDFRKEIAKRLFHEYPEIYFEAINNLTAFPSDNSAFPMLNSFMDQLENIFDQNYLCIFEDLISFLLNSRFISREAYILLLERINREKAKSTQESVISSNYKRNYAGFAYKKFDGDIKYFVDAVYYLAVEKRNKFIEKGYLVSPILSKTYYADSFNTLEQSKGEFRSTLLNYIDSNFFSILEYLHALPPSVDKQTFSHYYDKVADTGSKYAIDAMKYYGHLWNVL